MIKDQWYAVLDSKEIKSQKAYAVKRLGEKMVFWRDASGKICCISDICCHRGVSLGAGNVIGNHVECPFHGFQYDYSGKVVLIPANGKNAAVGQQYKVKSYIVRELHGLIWLYWGEAKENIPDPYFFEYLKTGFSYGTFIDHWNVHYSRAVENQLDVVHLPFVHRTTIGRGNKTLVNGPVVEREGSLLRFFLDNRVDNGTTVPLKPEQMPGYKDLFCLEFNFPNIWQNLISDKVRAFAAFVPVDDENTIVYIRFYQKISKLPVIRNIINWFGVRSSIIILRQDKRVVITQLPKKSEMMMDEKLIMGDAPIIEYRKYRHELKSAIRN
ncbi:MAG: aromatic ring-hydroxylating dioxygenase subunit alpha [Bacteroidota bacterium]